MTELTYQTKYEGLVEDAFNGYVISVKEIQFYEDKYSQFIVYALEAPKMVKVFRKPSIVCKNIRRGIESLAIYVASEFQAHLLNQYHCGSFKDFGISFTIRKVENGFVQECASMGSISLSLDQLLRPSEEILDSIRYLNNLREE